MLVQFKRINAPAPYIKALCFLGSCSIPSPTPALRHVSYRHAIQSPVNLYTDEDLVFSEHNISRTSKNQKMASTLTTKKKVLTKQDMLQGKWTSSVYSFTTI